MKIDISNIVKSINKETTEKISLTFDSFESRLGDLGDFSLLLTSKGAEDADKFTAQNITGVKVQWEPGQEFKNLLDDAEFNLVASRSAQATVRLSNTTKPTTPTPLTIVTSPRTTSTTTVTPPNNPSTTPGSGKTTNHSRKSTGTTSTKSTK